mmetsp:Transcript_3374/g.6828  ORF Transcript_3374/g.6828 Transcript_3374/m.6828 type:complete len:365 (+) Transcript_3374:47-1141(+)
MDDDEVEYTLLNKREVLVYQIPPASSSAGHKADDWKKCIWRGRCRIAGKGRDLMIKMIDANSGQLFAQCTIPNGQYENYVERAIDSSRYFVLKITNGQRHAFIGLGFEERNDAFDFNCTLSDFKSTWIDRESQAEELPASQEPSKDLSLKDGQKITISLKGMEGRTRRQESTEAAGAAAGGFTGILAPPPPSSGQSRRQQPNTQQPVPQQPAGVPAAPPVGQPVGQQHVAAAPAAPQEDFFSDFADFQSAGSAAPPGADAAPYTAAPAGLPAQFEQLNLGNAPSQPPMKSSSPTHLHQQMPPQTSPATPADPFSGMGLLGDSSSKQSGIMPGATASRPPAPMQFDRVQQGPPKRDPFDEFDIFK